MSFIDIPSPGAFAYLWGWTGGGILVWWRWRVFGLLELENTTTLTKECDVLMRRSREDEWVGWQSNWLSLLLWAVGALMVWGFLVTAIGVRISYPLIFADHTESLKSIFARSGGEDPIGYVLASVLLATGAKVTIPTDLGINTTIQAVGWIHLMVILVVLAFVGWRANQASADPRMALSLTVAHGVVIWGFVLLTIAMAGGKIDVGFLGLDAVWRYVLMALIVGVVLSLGGGVSPVPLSAVIGGGFLGWLGSIPAVSGEELQLTSEEIVESNAWRAATGQPHIFCRRCGMRLAIFSKERFCKSCGYPKGIPNSERSCSACEAAAALSDQYCFKCGAQFAEFIPLSQGVASGALAGVKFCHWCGREIDGGEEKCSWSDCGRLLRRDANRALCPSCQRLGVYPGEAMPQHCVFCGALYVPP